MAFRTIRAQLMNCPINYKDAKEELTKQNTKTVVIAPQECVGQNRSN
jgi:NAD-dependent dihydropyrimidine dehydrogenase PreA subunit